MWTVSLSLLVPNSHARPAIIYGNANGLWSPTHPHLTSGRSKPRSPVLYVPPTPEPDPITDTEVELEIAEFDVCPTLQSAPHLCQTL